MNREDFFRLEKKDGIATIWLHIKHEKMNVVSPALIEYFDDVFNEIANDDSIRAGIVISDRPDFIAGADIKAFKAEKKGDFLPLLEHGHKSLNALENAKKPVIAAIHGTAYGLGTELSLACHGRICSDDRKTKFALPEVKLGLLPGGGGTQRLPRLVGLQKSLDMMLTGKNIFARQAKRIGLVDEIVNKNKLHIAAVKLADKIIKNGGKLERKRKRSLMDKFLDGTGIGRNLVYKKAREKVFKLTQGNYPAVPKIIDCVEYGLKNGLEKGYQFEREGFEELMLTQVSKELRQIFFNMTDNKKNPYQGKFESIDRIGILGAGFMGAGIAEVSILNQMDVVLKDINQEVIRDAKKLIWKSIKKKLKRKQISKVEADTIIERVRERLDYEGFEHIDLVVEAVVEKMDLKKSIITELEKHCPEDYIFATNTSALSVTEMANHAKKPENVIGMHYFSPVPKMPLLEIIKTEFTSDRAIGVAYDVGVRQGKTCIVVQDGPGFYANRILCPYLNEVMLMIEEGANLEALDKAMKKKGMPVGPVALLDEVGIDVGAHVMSGDMIKIVESREGVTIAQGLPKMFNNGYLGKKNKKGFYKYDGKNGRRNGANPAVYEFFGNPPKKDFTFEDMTWRPLLLMINEALNCLEEKILFSPTDGDLGAVFGLGFLPFTGGPFRFIDSYGAQELVDLMKSYEDRFGPKFKSRPILNEMAANNNKFHKVESNTIPLKLEEII
ncbi:MAG: 3-hydroxyacyl-CoA dehydrogenase/enoyl-CoA hydratase/3-hydroxybutyryl-CoA epimerase [Parvicellaceae bacterium]|jgi:3-hydroxyacyl-CoA dehydrogenase/enoyl-CoA hydratase/3-hydroxybutyryl-CoA epimerase